MSKNKLMDGTQKRNNLIQKGKFQKNSHINILLQKQNKKTTTKCIVHIKN